MGNYNPYIPQILGQEWVPILEQPLTLTPRTNLVEVGHMFTLATNRRIQTARFHLQDWPPDNATSQVLLANVYRHGTAHLTGPIQSVVIPCSLGTAFGGSVTLSGSAPTIASALFSPSDNAYVIVNTGGNPFIDLRFDTESYLPQLIGKRILGIDFLYTYIQDDAGELPLLTDLILGSGTSGTIIASPMIPTNTDATGVSSAIGRQTVGEIDFYWQAPTISTEVLPWSPNRLRAFDNGSGLTERVLTLSVSGNPPTANQSIWYGYAAIEVFFCEEQRVLYGGRLYGSGSANYVFGTNQITMRDLADTANPILTPGVYDVVLASAELSAQDNSIYPELNQLRELYPIPSHPPLRLIRPFPLNTSIGKEFSTEETLLLPQVSLHTSGGPLTEVHVYGRQAAAQVYGNITATQEIYDTPVLGTASYPWVRYYARRFGDTVVPLRLSSVSPTVSGSSVEITPTEFDALDEIVDGWKEVTLRFDVPPSMGAGNSPQWRWSATGETAGSRWEVLGTYAPALSGAPFNPFNRVPSPHQLSIATYGMPVSGANVNLGWVPQYAPPVSATVDDQTADASVIFSQDPPAISGFTVSQQSQEVMGIGLDCGVNPCCIPSEIQYLEVSWGVAEQYALFDSFTRNVVEGYGTADSGQTWEVVTATITAPHQVTGFSVDGDEAVNAHSLAARTMSMGPDVDIELPLEFSFRSRLPNGSGGSEELSIALLGTNYLQIGVSSGASTWDAFLWASDGTVTLSVTDLTDIPVNTEWVNISGRIDTSSFAMKVWADGTDEPEAWTLSSGYPITLTPDMRLVLLSWTGDAPRQVAFDSLVVSSESFSAYELQRSDTVETEWKTIMRATNPATSGFSDYEARVGIDTSYRIRMVNVYDFTGPWSSIITGAISEPGVTIGCEGGHLLIFTSNEEQDGSLNLAYSSVWENRVEETFAFPEARFVELQAMYNRDYFTAFRPTERGGEQFSRTVLVQAAAISPETLADFTSLRDMAWANVSYICVRDEDGNRWFATVLVPSGRVVHSRKLYMAPVEIIEVTDTPSEVDP